LGEERFGTEPQITHEVVMSLRSPRENENGGVSRILLGPPFPLMGKGRDRGAGTGTDQTSHPYFGPSPSREGIVVLKSFHLGVDSNDLNVEQNHCNKIYRAKTPRRKEK
jgi:hypothetical protein